jgi:hypothetical protein
MTYGIDYFFAQMLILSSATDGKSVQVRRRR